MRTIAPEAPPLPEVPYRGIESFRYIDQNVLSAREEETWDLLSHILIYRGVLLYGDSGSGKSSLINAGLIPAAQKENLIANRLRIQPRRGREIKLERIPTEADNRPPYLPSIFVEEGSPNEKAMSLEISLEDFFERLERLREMPADKPRPLLIFDQFEEFITLFEEALHGGETPGAKVAQKDAPQVQEAILATLTRLMEDEKFPVKILFVFREEYLAKLNVLFKVCPELLDQYVRLLPPRVEMAEQIISAPFVDEKLKAKFTGGAHGAKEIPAAAIAAQLQQRSESGYLNLPELQIVCSRLWESQDPVAFFRGKDWDVQKVVEDYYTDVLKKLGALYDPAIALLSHMVTSSNTRNIITEPDLRYHEKDNFPPDQIDAALDALVARRLVRREPRHKIYFYEIASEFLVPWIQEKKSKRVAQIEARRLAAEAEQKLKQGERVRRNLLIGAIVLGSLLIVAVLLAIKSYRLEKVAVAAQTELQTQKDWSDNLVKLLNHLTSADPQVRLAAVKDLVVLDQKKNLPRELVQVIVAVTANDGNKEISKAASYFFSSLVEQSETNPTNSDLTASILRTAEEKNTDLTKNQQSSKLPPRVYIQIASNGQRARAEKIAAGLRSVGFTVPGYEVVGNRAPKTNQLRYYKSLNDADPSSTNVATALQKIKETDGSSWTAVQLQSSTSARPGHFELWFATDLAPTPTPLQDVMLNLHFQDEQGNALPLDTFTVSLDDDPFTGTIIKHIRSFPVAPGKYVLHVQAFGYQDYREEITIQRSVTQKVQLRARRGARPSP